MFVVVGVPGQAMQSAIGAVIVHPPVVTPWDDRNARVQDPDGMQVTLFQEAKG